jgi:hypothetical protein
MATQSLNLPVAIPWLQVAVSPDMMDEQFCNKRFPFSWRSSMAISIFEPPPDEIPEDLCGQRLTYLKVTCSITGYQPSREETEAAYVEFPNVPTEALDLILSEYFACYGVLLNVAVFPFPSTRAVERLLDTIEFTGLEEPEVGGLPNPLTIRDVTFEAPGQPANNLVDLFPEGGDGIPELDLQGEMVVTLATPADRVVARVVRTTPGDIVMSAFRGEEAVGEATAGEDPGMHSLSIEAEDVDRLTISAPEGPASLIDLSYFDVEREQVPIRDFPHIVDVEPKLRDLYQAASETGEVLTASTSSVKTDKTLASTEQTETGFKLGAEVPIPQVPGSKVTGSFERKRTEKEEDTWSVGTDASRERRETQGTTTQLSQMYNLLSAYHVGTNRASFLMLPRPHVLQATDHRTFVQGLRYIEGIQEFLLIVSRPEDIEGIAVEASLDTGHFPEDVDVEEPEEEFDESEETFAVTAFADNGTFSGDCTDINHEYTVQSPWVVDATKGDLPQHPGISMIADNNNGQANDSLENYNYGKIGDAAVAVTGRICGERFQGDKARFNRTYKVFTRSAEPKPSSGGPSVVTPFLITSRSLCVRVRSGDPCPTVVPLRRPFPPFPPGDWVVSEDPVKVATAMLRRHVTTGGRTPVLKELLREIQGRMATSWRLRTRYPNGEITFLDTSYFADRIGGTIPVEILERPVRELPGLPEPVGERLEQIPVGEVLRLPLAELARRTGTDIAEAARARRRVLAGAVGQR